MTAPAFWIVAGPNGSGKSTLLRLGLLDPWVGKPLRALSPDDVVIQLRSRRSWPSEQELLRAAQRQSDSAVDDALAAGEDVMVETVLSSMKFQQPVLTALKAGYELGFVYVTVRSAELNIERVASRVVEGGHDVPEDRIRERRRRSAAAVPWFASRATIGLVLDNSGVGQRVLAEKRRSDPHWRHADPAALVELGISLGP